MIKIKWMCLLLIFTLFSCGTKDVPLEKALSEIESGNVQEIRIRKDEIVFVDAKKERFRVRMNLPNSTESELQALQAISSLMYQVMNSVEIASKKGFNIRILGETN
ncbi:hypothetical protein [Desulfonema magnum]|uniref:Uncharacterized protein n=1 Tax=Desulfonema magnum TaxID=45655 RepID=A0A975GSB3_9BACT|nr:hypothetical protein [Desulfonema magnum]QTA90898.1 Uncharacterized protein dnm_069600 [Desulfonema magnum]